MSHKVNRNGIEVIIWQHDRKDWRFIIGTNVYSGFATLRDAKLSVSNYI